MKEIYAEMPTDVEVYQLGAQTDVILRKNLEKVTIGIDTDAENTTGEAWQCDEVQFRYDGTLTKEEVAEAFDDWWDYGQNKPKAVDKPTIEQRVTALESATLGIMGMMM